MKTKEWLIKNRKKRGLTQKELADKTGINIFTIENIEQGKRLGSVETWGKIESFFESIDGFSSVKISYDSEDLIDEIKADIEEFGEDEPCVLVYKIIDNNIIFTNYDFIVEEKPFNPKAELDKDEKFIETTLKYALEVFEAQDKIL